MPGNALHQRIVTALILATVMHAGTAMTSMIDRAKAAEPAVEVVHDRAITIEPGEIFEMMPVTEIPNASYAWVLTRDRTFIEAGQGRIFRTRQTEPGTYTLSAEVFSADRSLEFRQMFTLDVKTAGAVPDSASGAIALPVVRLTMRAGDFTTIDLDLDRARDSNGDGDQGNDVDDGGTFFQQGTNDLWLWFPTFPAERPIRITAVRQDGSPLTQDLTLTPGSSREINQTVQHGTLQATVQDDGSTTFTLSTPADAAPLLIHWNFGDGTESLENAPVHRYRASGTYSVLATTRDLRTGKEIQQSQLSLTVTVAPIPAVATGSKLIPPEPEIPATLQTTGRSFSMGLIVKIVLVLAGSLLLGALLVVLFVFVKKRVGNVQQTLEQVEAKIVKKSVMDKGPMSVIDATVAPMKIKPFDATHGQPFATTSPPPPSPKAEPPAGSSTAPVNAPVPNWLQSGLAQTFPETEPAAKPHAPVKTETKNQRANEPTSQPSAPQRPPAPPAPPIPPVSVPPSPPKPPSVTPPSPPPSKPPTPPPTPRSPPPPPSSPPPPLAPPPPPLPPPPRPTSTPPVRPAVPSPAFPIAKPPALTPPAPAVLPVTPKVVASVPDVPDAERERRRRKRQRYRENLKKRMGKDSPAKPQATPESKPAPADDEPIAIIRAESLEPNGASDGD